MDHIYEYFEQIRPRFKKFSSGGISDDELDEMFRASPDAQRGLVSGLLYLDETAFIDVFERVALQEGRPHRIRYSYYLIVDGAERRGYDRNPLEDPPEHRHGEGHQMEPWPAVTFAEAAEEFWDIFTQLRMAESERDAE